MKSPHDRSTIYLNLLPALNAGQVKLLDMPRIRSQLLALERRTVRGSGRDVVDHPSAGSDDLINVAAGALVMAAANSTNRHVQYTCLGTSSDGAVIGGVYQPSVGAPYEEVDKCEWGKTDWLH
jgi:hypothetical protein